MAYSYKRHSDYTYNDYNTCRADVYIQRCELRQRQQYYVDEEFPNDRGAIKPPLATRERLSASVLSICLFVCLSVSLSVAKIQKTLFSQKLSNLELWSLLTTYRESYIGFSKNPLLNP